MAPLQFATVASRAYLPYARALEATIRRHQPDSTLWILLVEDHEHSIEPSNPTERLLWNEQLGIPPAELHRLLLIHGGQFLAAVKPFFLEHVLNTTGGPVLYIDSDIQLYSSLEDVGELIAEKGVVLFPHALSPYPLDDKGPDDTTILTAGTFNAGMIGVGSGGARFLEFLKSRLRRECVIDIMRMRVNEQRWLDYAPSFFDAHILRDAGVNAAYWNLHERPLSRVGDQVFAGDALLRAYHFSGHDLDAPAILSRHAGPNPRVQLENEPILQRLCADYRDAVISAGGREAARIPIDFNALPGGIVIDPTLRETFRQAVITAEQQGKSGPPDPYDLEQRALFLKWVEVAYMANNLPLPQWLGRGVGSRPAPENSTPPSAPDDQGELLRRLATSSSAAFSILDQRVSQLEQRMALIGRSTNAA